MAGRRADVVEAACRSGDGAHAACGSHGCRECRGAGAAWSCAVARAGVQLVVHRARWMEGHKREREDCGRQP